MRHISPKRALKSRTKIEDVARLAASRAAAIHRKYYESGVRIRHKASINLVTVADEEAQAAIVRTISKAFPGDDIVAEEGELGRKRDLSGPVWVVDPLDGTTNFSRGFPMFGVSIAYRDGDETQFGIIVHPLLRETFVSHRGKGASMNGERLHVAKSSTLGQSLLATGFPYDRATIAETNLEPFCWFEMRTLCVRRAGAASIDLAYVARGRLEGFWEPKLYPWDVAAGALLVEEAGGTVTDYAGKPLTDLWCGEIVASNGRIHAEILDGLRQTRPVSPLRNPG